MNLDAVKSHTRAMIMKPFRLFALSLALFAAVLVLSPVRARAEVSFDFFYDNLSPYGQWVDIEGYGTCWQPANVDRDWSPYADGYWAYTDAGWTWVSYEDFGGIVYHYGRWVRVEEAGWCWVPDYQWAPAWVSWRYSDDYVGWAPLPPEVRWRRDVGISVWVDSEYDIGPGYYSFCRVRDFGAPVLRPVIISRAENVMIIRGTLNVTNITYNTGFGGGAIIFNGGPNFAAISAVVVHPVPALKLVVNVNLDPASWRHHNGPNGLSAIAAQTVGNQLIVAAPLVSPPADPAAFRAKAKLVIGADKISRGWGLVPNRQAEQDLRKEIHRQAKGLTPESAPARPVAIADLKFVPLAADPHAKASLASTGESHEKSSKDRHPENIVAAPANVPPGSPFLKPFNSDPGGKSGSQNPPSGKGTASVEGPAQEQGRVHAEEERTAKERQIAAEQEEARRHESEVPPQRAADVRRGQDSEKDREREKFEPQRANQFPPPVQRGNQPAGSPPPGAHHSKDSKDSKDKEKDKNNGN